MPASVFPPSSPPPVYYTKGKSLALQSIKRAQLTPPPRRTIHLEGVPEYLTRGIDTGVFLALTMFVEMAALRRNGIRVAKAPVQKSDHMGHLTGFFVGIIAAIMVRLKDPKWKDVKREHWYTDIFTSDAEEPRES